MPLEGHYKRANTPLRRLTRRERNVVLAGLAVTVVALLALVLATAGDSQPPPAAGCIRVAVAGRVGGELIHPCGAEAVATCKRSATFDSERSRTIVAACEEAGIEF
jgi:predicted metal-binding membrane protein